jgi:hypothetical protein
LKKLEVLLSIQSSVLKGGTSSERSVSLEPAEVAKALRNAGYCVDKLTFRPAHRK